MSGRPNRSQFSWALYDWANSAFATYPAPSAGADAATVPQGEVTAPIAVLDNDVDNSPAGLAGDGLTVTAVGSTPAGTARLVGNTIEFTPDADFFGTTTFSYTVQDARRSVDYQTEGIVTVEVVGLPATPQAATIDSIGNSYLVVGWQNPQRTEGRAPVSGYILQYTGSDGSTGREVLETSTTSFRWNGLTNAVRYCFSVIATNQVGESEPSPSGSDISCGIPDVRPEAPPAPTLTSLDGALRIDWVPPLTQGSEIIDYRLRLGGGRQAVSSPLGSADTSDVWDGLINGTEYTIEVQARNNATENDGWSEWSPATTGKPFTFPDAPNAPTVQRGKRPGDLDVDGAGRRRR